MRFVPRLEAFIDDNTWTELRVRACRISYDVSNQAAWANKYSRDERRHASALLANFNLPANGLQEARADPQSIETGLTGRSPDCRCTQVASALHPELSWHRHPLAAPQCTAGCESRRPLARCAGANHPSPESLPA